MVEQNFAANVADNPWNDARALLAECRGLISQSINTGNLAAERERVDSNFDVAGTKQLIMLLLKDSKAYQNKLNDLERTIPAIGVAFDENNPNELTEVLRVCGVLSQLVEQWAIVVNPTIQNILAKITEERTNV